MADDAPLPQPDQVEGAPHPRETTVLFGQDAAERAFLEAWGSGRMHHAWMLTGPQGVGKATLAWRIARFLLADDGHAGMFGPPDTLDMAPDTPTFRRALALSDPRLVLLRRPWNDKTKKLRTEITVEEVRKLKGFFGMSAADGGWRVAIVDAMDEMNGAAANAFLKLLEEPPEKVALLLVTHQPGRLLPTIRSRCRELRLPPLGAEPLAAAMTEAGFEARDQAQALAELSGGSAGEAIGMLTHGGVDLYRDIIAMLSSMPGADRRRVVQFAESMGARGAEDRTDLAHRLIRLALHRLARAGATGRTPPEAVEGERDVLMRLSPNATAARHWATVMDQITARVAHARGVNLDPAQVMLDTCLQIDATAQTAAPRT
ncbi:DNA polymerase-3 subunit delta' [Rubricella aquisinus]|uniref:DNA polymerase-3 subunit delta n=1 Tax=Rubricella aquisinus TaxID=2028108 RepID=A0A840X6X6_9RHOB|nr:DNA polymerase III subunit delta' [Rubricella aquisinus]MBB5516457.1 DNA polymerase-3 subunit delta' [Rubricella aquisinus]